MVRSSTANPCSAERLEERDLRLDHGEIGECGDADVAELGEPVAVHRQAPRAQKLLVRVDAGAERPPPGHRVGQPAPEPAHRYDPSTLCSSCSDITSMSPRMPASMP